MEKVIIPLVIILVIVGVIAGVVFYVKNKVRKFSQDLFGTDSLVEGWKKQEEELSVTPAGGSPGGDAQVRLRHDQGISAPDSAGFPGI